MFRNWCLVWGLIPARTGKTVTPPPPSPPRSAHPRACGENLVLGTPMMRHWGSSPRVRGKPVVDGAGAAEGGLIPARTGKTPRTTPSNPRSRAHPHAYGENSRGHARPPFQRGSSPRVRGKHAPPSQDPPRGGLIPARTGKTTTAQLHSMINSAHPRACGENMNPGVHHAPRTGSSPRVRENAAASGKDVADAGSSPRVRGKRALYLLRGPTSGLIPARAGKTPRRIADPAHRAAHPRACGENAFITAQQQLLSGSSPRVRGKLRPHHWHGDLGRLIPARAGKTPRRRRPPDAGRAHPRACGENVRWTSQADREGGSSPRVRGKLPGAGHHHRRAGLIPARAGKTSVGIPTFPGGEAHPRACGENPQGQVAKFVNQGSSPRVRGKLEPADRVPVGRGLIPARAGKTWGGRALPVVGGGSSPRVRGKRSPPRRRPISARLIPARAGKTEAVAAAAVGRPAHPRACGENSRKCPTSPA